MMSSDKCLSPKFVLAGLLHGRITLFHGVGWSHMGLPWGEIREHAVVQASRLSVRVAGAAL
jgi:hypothetical protein